MRVHTRTVYQYNPATDSYDLLEDDWFEYEGPMAMAGGSSKPQTTTTKSDPWDGMKPYLLDYYQRANQWANNPSTQGPQVAGMDPLSYQGQNQMIGGINQAQRQLGGVQSAVANVMNQSPESGGIANYQPAMNQALSGQVDMAPIQGMVDAAGKQIGGQYQGYVDDALSRFNESVLPNIRGDAISAGGYGGSRQQLSTGLAAGKLQQELIRQAGAGRDQLNSMSANLYGDAMSRAQQIQGNAALQTQGLAEQSRQARTGQSMAAAGMMPGLMALPMQWGGMLNQIGGQRQNQRQMELDAAAARADLPYQNLQRYGALLTGAGNPGGTQTQSTPMYRNSTAGALGGALGGASMGSMLGTPFGLGFPGAAIGGGIGLLGGAFGW